MKTKTYQDYEAILVQAYERGKQQGYNDIMNGYRNLAPLSGEWAAESPKEILGDLINEAEQVRTDPDMDAYEDVCDLYEQGYFEGQALGEEN